MQDEPIPDRSRAPQVTDEAIQSAVLNHLLSVAPAQLTVDELLREMTSDPNSFPERDSIICAVRDLNGAGLLHHHDDFIFPTRAALYRERLPMT